MIHFCHTADWHLDYFQYNKKERWVDFFSAANECAKLILEEKPDFIIHCGDLFHQFRPTPGALRLAIDILKKFKDANIPFYVIRGNHDASKAQAQRFGGTILRLLEKLDYLIYIQDDTIDFNENCTLTGIGEYGKATGIVVEEVLRNHPINKKKFNLLALHGYVQGQVSDSIYDMSGYELASTGYNYIALGHYHKKWEDKENNLYCPGSTEQTSLNDWGKPEDDGFFQKSGYYSVKVSQDNDTTKWKVNAKWKIFDVRPKGIFNLNFEENTPIEEIINKAKEFITKNDKKNAVIRFHFSGILPIGMQGMINLTKLPTTIQMEALHVIVTQDFTGKTHTSTKVGLSSDEALTEILNNSYNLKKKNVDKWIDLVNETIRILGQKNISTDNADELKVIYELIGETSDILTENLDKKESKTKESPKEKKEMKKPDKVPITNNNNNTKQSALSQFFKEGE